VSSPSLDFHEPGSGPRRPSAKSDITPKTSLSEHVTRGDLAAIAWEHPVNWRDISDHPIPKIEAFIDSGACPCIGPIWLTALGAQGGHG